MDEECWDNDTTTAQTNVAPLTDSNNNQTGTKSFGFGSNKEETSDEYKSSGFGSSFGERRGGFGGGRGGGRGSALRSNNNDGERIGFGGFKRDGGGFGSRDNKEENNENGEERNSFGFGGRRESNEDGEKKEGGFGGGFGSRFGSRRDNNDEESKEGGFAKRDGSGFGRRDGSGFGKRDGSGFGKRDGSGFGKRDGSGFGTRRENNNDDKSGERKGFGFGRRDNNEIGEKREGGFVQRREGGFGGGERREGSFGRRDNNHENGEKREGGFGVGFRRESGGFGAKSRFGARRENDDENGEKNSGGFRGFHRRDNNEDGERKEGGFGGGRHEGGGFGRRDNNENGERREGGFGQRKEGGFGGGERREGGFGGRSGGGGFGRRDNNDENGEKREGGFGRRENGSERRSGFGGDREGGDDNKEGKTREKYIPEDDEDNEAKLFHSISVGINFDKQSEIGVQVTGAGSEDIKPISNFEEAYLSELLFANVQKSNYKMPTPVQKYAIPIILKNRDLMACAQTGSGKTAAFVLPIMTNILKDGIQSSAFSQIQEPQALILSPTRELASQIFNECKKFSFGSIIKSGILYGGVDTGYQLSNLNKGCNLLVATPGRLLDVLEKQKISLAKVKYFVLDEADRMLDLGFEKTVREILEKGSIQRTGERVTLMFSATFPKEIQQLAQDFLHDYLFLTVGVLGGANSDVEQQFHKVTRFDKRDKVIQILNEIGNDRVMIFIEHKKQADVLAFFLLQKGYPTTSIHGDRLQSQRESALRDFKGGKSNVIVCTSVAARGLDIEKVNHVVNYDLPQTIDEYVHRIGRTGRCGNPGKAISFFDPESENDIKLARPLARILTDANQTVPEWLSEQAEGAIGTAFTGKDCTNDLRNKLYSIKLNSKVEPTGETQKSTIKTVNEEEEW